MFGSVQKVPDAYGSRGFVADGSITYSFKNYKEESILSPKALPKSVNRFYTQYFPTLTIDNNTLIFTKRAGDSGNYDEDLVISQRESGVWSRRNYLVKISIQSSMREQLQYLQMDVP